MKKSFLIIAFLLISIIGYSQSRRPFIFGGIGATPTRDVSLSFEAGYWGIESSTSFSLTYDVSRNLNTSDQATQWVGIKPYFTILDNKEISLMVYAMPKANVSDLTNVLLEYGFNPNYKVGDDNLISLTIGNQVMNTGQTTTFFSFGYIRLF